MKGFYIEDFFGRIAKSSYI